MQKRVHAHRRYCQHQNWKQRRTGLPKSCGCRSEKMVAKISSLPPAPHPVDFPAHPSVCISADMIGVTPPPTRPRKTKKGKTECQRAGALELYPRTPTTRGCGTKKHLHCSAWRFLPCCQLRHLLYLFKRARRGCNSACRRHHAFSKFTCGIAGRVLFAVPRASRAVTETPARAQQTHENAAKCA